jgi:hypothetical protein
MKIKSSIYQYFWIILLAFLAACGKKPLVLPTELPAPIVVSPTPTAEAIPTLIAPTLTPTQPIIFIKNTPDAIQVEKWKEYQTELAKVLLPFLQPETVLCEWEILGRVEQELYVWAVCQGMGSSVSVPVVIHLDADGTIRNVEFPKHWSQDIQVMFPAYVREKFDYYNFGRADELAKHIEWRRTHPEEPPLIVFSTTPTP